MAGLRMGAWVHPDKAAMFDHLLFLCALGQYFTICPSGLSDGILFLGSSF
jgi:hypothetical protein